MPRLRIFCNFPLKGSDLALFLEGTKAHETIMAETMATSAREQPREESFEDADIVFGQPSVESVLKSPRLRWVQLSTAGYARYDTKEFRAGVVERGIAVSTCSEVYAEPCAEHVFAFMLAQSRNLPAGLQGRWEAGAPGWWGHRNTLVSLRNQTALILGYGSIAAKLVKLLTPFQMRLLAFRRAPRGDESIPVIGMEELPSALASADHVVNLLPDNAASLGFISRERLAMMKSGSVFYNIGRGATVDHDALASALQSGPLAAAWLDVTEPEPLPESHPLRKLPNCFITPHSAGGQRNEVQAIVRHFLDNLRRFENGEPLHNRVM